jgi:hypothetical protein
MQGAGVRPWFFTQKAQYGSLRRPVLACIDPVLPPKIISSYKEIRDLPRAVRLQWGKEIGMTRIAGALVLICHRECARICSIRVLCHTTTNESEREATRQLAPMSIT